MRKVIMLISICGLFQKCIDSSNDNNQFTTCKSSIDTIIGFKTSNFTFDGFPLYHFEINTEGHGALLTRKQNLVFFKDSILFFHTCSTNDFDTLFNLKMPERDVPIWSDRIYFYVISQKFWSEKHKDTVFRINFGNIYSDNYNTLLVSIKKGIVGIYDFCYSPEKKYVIDNYYGDIFIEELGVGNVILMK